MPLLSRWRLGAKLEAFLEAIGNKVIFSAEQGEALPSRSIGFMCNKGILGGEVSHFVQIRDDACHLPFEPVMMLILLLM